jgi:thioredoxin 1
MCTADTTSSGGDNGMSVTNLSKDHFQDVVTKNDLVIVDFWAPWCGPCRSFAPIFREASEKHTDIVFAKVNTEDEPELAATFGIRSIPTLMIFREQVIIYAQPGALPASALAQLIAQAQALDMAQVHKEVATQQAKQASR